MSQLVDSDAWQNLINLQDKYQKTSIKDLFDNDPDRVNRYSFQLDDLMIDLSKNLINQEIIDNLIKLAESANLSQSIESFFKGDKLNYTENRPALHFLLRDLSQSPFVLDAVDLKLKVNQVLDQMKDFSQKINQSELLGCSGRVIKNIVNIGIGGSDLGPESVYLALSDYANPRLVIRFISNIDYDNFYTVLKDLDPAETIFLISSKTFSTDETIVNALSAQAWLSQTLAPNSFQDHLYAITANPDQAHQFGISTDHIFEFWDWVGGRYSVCSAIGLIIMISIGWSNFQQFLTGFYQVDQHFKTTPLVANVPVLLALISIWYHNFWNYRTEAIIPYSYHLSLLPAYLQQAVMESNGKNVNKQGQVVDYLTSPVVWGQSGTNAQHAFFQLYHQGTEIVPVDFIGFMSSTYDDPKHRSKLLANMLAQAQALAFGRTDQVTDMNRQFFGNRPSNIFLAKSLSPKALGQIIGLYEAKIFCQGIIWQINSFDQYGVELGKLLAGQIEGSLNTSNHSFGFDSSTNSLLDYIKNKPEY
jgi:glucose-6-phosphate isomerase